jgi:hypothetical protein
LHAIVLALLLLPLILELDELAMMTPHSSEATAADLEPRGASPISCSLLILLCVPRISNNRSTLEIGLIYLLETGTGAKTQGFSWFSLGRLVLIHFISLLTYHLKYTNKYRLPPFYDVVGYSIFS